MNYKDDMGNEKTAIIYKYQLMVLVHLLNTPNI